MIDVKSPYHSLAAGNCTRDGAIFSKYVKAVYKTESQEHFSFSAGGADQVRDFQPLRRCVAPFYNAFTPAILLHHSHRAAAYFTTEISSLIYLPIATAPGTG